MTMKEGRDETLTTADLAAGTEERAAERASAPKGMHQAKAATEPGPAEQGVTAEAETTPLFPTNEADGFRSRWDSIQTSFVDEPRRAVEQADSLVAEVIKRLADTFASERGKLEEQWGRGEDVDTEEFRVALRRYRSFFDRLLSV